MPEVPKLIMHTRQPQGSKGAQLVADGRGSERAVQAEAARLFALTDPKDPGPRVVTSVKDVTAGLGLDGSIAQRVQNVVAETRTDYTKRSGGSALPRQRASLMQTLRALGEDIPQGAHAEIMARATSWWRANGSTGYGAPTGASVYGKSESLVLIDAERIAEEVRKGLGGGGFVGSGPGHTKPQYEGTQERFRALMEITPDEQAQSMSARSAKLPPMLVMSPKAKVEHPPPPLHLVPPDQIRALVEQNRRRVDAGRVRVDSPTALILTRPVITLGDQDHHD